MQEYSLTPKHPSGDSHFRHGQLDRQFYYEWNFITSGLSNFVAFKFEENGNANFGWLKIGPTGGYYYFRSYGYVSN